MKWCREHLRLTIILVILIVLLTLTVASFLNQGSSSWLGVQIQKVATYIQEPAAEASSTFSASVKSIFQWKALLNEKEELERQNRELRQELISQSLSRQELAELQKLSEALNFLESKDKYTYLTGSVIAMDGSRWFNVFTINVGAKDGVYKNAVVVNGDGLVGRVFDLGPDWSKVVSVIDENNDVSFQVYRDLALIGVLSGDGAGSLSGYLLEEDVQVVEGDLLITSGMEIYPQGIPIGRIINVDWDGNALLRTVKVEPAVNFSSLQKITVIIKEPSGTE